jgi:hypothetical protein
VASSYDFERLLEELSAAPMRAEARAVFQQFQRRLGEDADIPEELLERVADIINEKPE